MTKPTLVCSEHPRYTGKYEPRAECLICWKIYATNLKLQLQKVKDGQRRK